MAIHDIGNLTAADESLTHQIVDTFAVVQQSDRGWTEKLWCAMASKDGSVSMDLGIGKYTNRNVMDAFGGVSRGYEQWTVRASRELSSAPDDTEVGPIKWEVLEPLKKVRLTLEENEHQPISFDVVFEGQLQPFFEERNRHRIHSRIENDVIRYHQGGGVTGWLSLEGERIEISDWIAVRDHSWGVRQQVGVSPSDLQPIPRPDVRKGSFHWTPWLFTNPDGSKYEIMQFISNNPVQPFHSAHIGYEDGTQEKIVSTEVTPTFDPGTRELRTATHRLVLESGEVRIIEEELLGHSGFHLSTAGYGGWAGSVHGSWKGDLHVDGDYVKDCLNHPDIGMVRDRPTKLRDGDAIGYGIHESFYVGQWPEFGIDASVPERRVT
ncbi:hypothetical protein [Rhodococcoides yunnanense]|uniref:hypothetical protein n=1 Tax=Rhodococcoides yunnanense TaxID=278209 RepID=UPI000933B54E|nr:hypothetical protein [Rhodococcus yunnanensis]